MKNVQKIMETVSLYDQYLQLENNNKYDQETIMAARADYMNSAISNNIHMDMLSRLSHMEHCHRYALKFNLTKEDMERAYPELLDWYSKYMFDEGEVILSQKFKRMHDEVLDARNS